ncbi:hypothetical protein DIE21_28645 [Burkholderia sp. Bp9140]|nr:hypothetical protein DIE21_28645 [Burkholderia sp. Bp9140]
MARPERSASTGCTARQPRLLTLCFFCFFAAYLDRVNIGLAWLQMLDALASAPGAISCRRK